MSNKTELVHPKPTHDFIRSLNDAIAWCSMFAAVDDPKNSLRRLNIELHPMQSQYGQLISVQYERSWQLRNQGIPESLGRDLQQGRLLAYWPDSNVADGASKAETEGFFDDADCPPQDTWMWFEEGLLICWIPSLFHKLVEDGIAVNPVEDIIWLERLSSHPIAEAIRGMGLSNGYNPVKTK